MKPFQKMRQELRESIISYFKKAKYPANDRIVYTPYGDSDPERAAFLNAYKGKRWIDVPDDIVKKHREIAYFASDGFCYYLPKFLLIALEKFDDIAFNITIDQLIFALTFRSKRDKWRAECFERLDLNQKETVAHVLDFYCRHVPEKYRVLGSDDALPSYWKQFI